MQIREIIDNPSTASTESPPEALRMPGSSSSWEMTVPRKQLNMQVVSNSGGLFAGER